MTGPIRALNPVDRARSAGRQYRNRLPRQRRVQMRMWRILALYGLLLTVYWAAFGEEAEPYPRVTREAFEARRPFFAYDKDIPLDGRVVLEKKGDHSTRTGLPGRAGVPGAGLPRDSGKCQQTVSAGCAPSRLDGGKEDWWQEGNYINGSEMRTALLEAGYAVRRLTPRHMASAAMKSTTFM